MWTFLFKLAPIIWSGAKYVPHILSWIFGRNKTPSLEKPKDPVQGDANNDGIYNGVDDIIKHEEFKTKFREKWIAKLRGGFRGI